MYSISEINGKQMWLETGRIYVTNRMPLKAGSKVSLTRILLTKQDSETAKIKVGTPYIKRNETQTNVNVTVLNHFKERKVIVYKMKPKKKMRRKMGHRQSASKFVVTEIN
jgi:large subunit ribosomal protein L21